jgi:hypothetical protein
MEKEKDELIKQLRKTNKYLARENSSWFQFYISIVRGTGIAIGITIIGGIVISVLDRFITSAHDIPILGKILTELQILFTPQ